MRYFIITCLALCMCITAQAQKPDSIFVKLGEQGWYIPYRVKADETIFSIARKYHVPPAVLADYNGINFQQHLTSASKLHVPVAAYNYQKKAAQANGARPIYFRVTGDVSLGKIARTSQVSQRKIQEWNALYDTELDKGQVLLVGWVMYDATDLTPKNNNALKQPPAPPKEMPKEKTYTTGTAAQTSEPFAIPAHRDTIALADSLLPGEDIYLEQTGYGSSVTEEKGTAVFFKRAGKSDGVYFAFHNSAKRGSIIKITNVGTEKTVFAKVIGTIPKTGAFYNAVIGISADAKAALDVRDGKAWCDISYAP